VINCVLWEASILNWAAWGTVCLSEDALPMGIEGALGCNGQDCKWVVFWNLALYPFFLRRSRFSCFIK